MRPIAHKEINIPEYDYECSRCMQTFTIYQKMKDDPLKDCEICNSPDSVRRVILSLPSFSVKNYTTIGSLADKNWKNLGTYGREKKLHEDNVQSLIDKKEKQKHLNKLNKMTESQKRKYIEDGE